MAETKRVSDQYTISAPLIIINGNLTVQGSTTSVETVNSTIKDNIIVLNQGEPTVDTDGGIISGESGFEIDRGFKSDGSTIASRPAIKYIETDDAFSVLFDSTLTNIKIAEPIDNNDAATKNYVDIKTATGSIGAAGIEGSVQYNSGGIISGDSNLLYDGFNLSIGDTTITNGSIFNSSTNSDLELYTTGTGTIYIRNLLKLENEVGDPTGIAGHNFLYAKTPASGGTGLYFSNTNNTDELVSRTKAIVFGIIF